METILLHNYHRSILQVYDLNPEKVRLDSTTASSYCGVSSEGLFQFGHSKDHRPDLAQVKIMLSTLDPLGMPIATEILPGNKADDFPLSLTPIYLQREDHITGLIRLLSIGLRVLTLLEFQVR